MNQLIKSKGQNFGLFYGIFLIFLTLYAYAIDINFFVSYWFLIFVIISFFVNAFWVMGSLKKAQAGLMSFKEVLLFSLSLMHWLFYYHTFTLLLFTYNRS